MRTASESFTRKAVMAWLAALLVLGCWLRVHGVGDYYYSLDELLSVSISKGRTVSEVIALSRYETHPPYAQILRHFLMVVNDAPWFVRGESVVFGLLTILVYYALGRQMGGRLAGCIAAALIAFGYGNILQSQIVRNYELMALFIGCGFYCCRAYLAAPRARYLWGYGIAMLPAMMTHYSAFFTLAVMGAAGGMLLLKQRRALYGWVLANGLLSLYFAFVYMTELRHNDYEAMWIPPTGSEYNTLAYRLAVFVAYIPATASYFLRADYVSEVNIASTVLFVGAAMWLWGQPARRTFFCESMAALLLGAVLVTANIYPYIFKVGGRHAIWVLPYVILPVSLFLAHAVRAAQAKWRVSDRGLIAAGGLVLIAGVILNPPELFLSDRREYQLDNQQMSQVRAFLDKHTPRDAFVTAGLNVMYLIPAGDNYYRGMNERPGKPWYFTTSTGASPILHARQYPPFIDGHEISMHEFVARLNEAGAFRDIDTVWFFDTDIIELTHSLAMCKGLPATIVQYPEGGLADQPDHMPMAEFIGIPKDVLVHDVLPEEGKYARCL